MADLEPEGRRLVMHIVQAKSHRTCKGHINTFLSWVLKKKERRGMQNQKLVSLAIRENLRLPNSSDLERELFDTGDVWPVSCTKADLQKLVKRISLMQKMALAVDFDALYRKLEERRKTVTKGRALLDSAGLCFQYARRWK